MRKQQQFGPAAIRQQGQLDPGACALSPDASAAALVWSRHADTYMRRTNFVMLLWHRDALMAL